MVENAVLQAEHPFKYIEVKQAKVHIDYHVTFKKNHYSVPHQYIGHKVLIRVTEHLVTIYHENRRIAHYVRHDRYGYSTDKSHLPPNHRWRLEWTPERFCKWSRQIGPHTEEVVSRVLVSRQHPQQSYRACLGILQFAKRYNPDSLEEACQQAHEAGVCSYRVIKHLLTTKKDMLETGLQHQTVSHEHVRGNTYYTLKQEVYCYVFSPSFTRSADCAAHARVPAGPGRAALLSPLR